MTIKTKPATAEYRDGYDRIFSKPTEGLELSQANLQKVLDSIPEGESITLKTTTAHVWVELPRFQRATIKMEGGVCDPDELEWNFRDSTELATYKDWKAQFDAEQDRLYGITK